MFRWHGCLYVLITLICFNPIYAQDCSSFSSCDTCTLQHSCAWCETSSHNGIIHICTINTTCSIQYTAHTCPQEASTRVWSNSIFILFLVFAIIMGFVILLTNGKRTQTLEEDVATMASNEPIQTLGMDGDERVSSSMESTDTAYCGFYTSSPSYASCCGVTVRQVFVSDEKFVVLSSNRAKMFFLLALILLVHGLWIGITFYLSGEDTNVGAIVFVVIICFIQILIITFYLWSVTIAIIDRTENQLVLKSYRSICNFESSQRYDIDTMSRIAIHRESITTAAIQRICSETIARWMKTYQIWNAKRKGNRIYHVTLMSQNGPITVIHNESLSSARFLRSRLGDFLRANQLYVLHQSSITSSYQPLTPRTVEEMRRMSSDRAVEEIRRMSTDHLVDASGRRISGYAQHDTSDATETLLNGYSHDEMEEKYNSQHDVTKNDVSV